MHVLYFTVCLSPSPRGSEKFLEFIQKEIRTWAPVIKAGNIQIE